MSKIDNGLNSFHELKQLAESLMYYHKRYQVLLYRIVNGNLPEDFKTLGGDISDHNWQDWEFGVKDDGNLDASNLSNILTSNFRKLQDEFDRLMKDEKE